MKTTLPRPDQHHFPARFERMGAGSFALCVLALAFFVWSLDGTNVSVRDFFEGLPQMGRLVGEMMPPRSRHSASSLSISC